MEISKLLDVINQEEDKGLAFGRAVGYIISSYPAMAISIWSKRDTVEQDVIDIYNIISKLSETNQLTQKDYQRASEIAINIVGDHYSGSNLHYAFFQSTTTRQFYIGTLQGFSFGKKEQLEPELKELIDNKEEIDDILSKIDERELDDLDIKDVLKVFTSPQSYFLGNEEDAKLYAKVMLSTGDPYMVDRYIKCRSENLNLSFTNRMYRM